MQYVHFIQKVFPQHELEIIHVAQRIKKIERDEQVFQEIIDQVRNSDGVLWAFPLYVFLVHAHYKRFIELIEERGVQDAFENKYTATLSTSIHFCDHTAHNYMHAICDDLNMRYAGAFSADMRDLLEEGGPEKLTLFAEGFFDAIENEVPTAQSFRPLVHGNLIYTPGPAQGQVNVGAKKIVIVTDAKPEQVNLVQMTERFKGAFSHLVETINLHELDIKGSCLGCLQCGYDNQCAYTGKDEYIDFYNTKLKPADIIVFAGAIHDRYLSSRWKMFFDRMFFNTHTPSLTGKQFGFIISGPFSQIPNLRQVMEAYVQFQCSNLVGFVTDEADNSAQVDRLLQDLAARLVRFADNGYIQPQTFLGVGGMKVFRDDVWGRLRIVFQADHRAYKQMGVYDFPQSDFRTRALNAMVYPLFKISKIREGFNSQIKEGMIRPYQKVLQG